MLVWPLLASVEVRSGHRSQSVCLAAFGSGLYVFSLQAICASCVHQCPGYANMGLKQ